jgi:predicted AlkP superfamily phosphohydrolase/phosphomutase
MLSPGSKNRVLMIALDAAEPSLVERWIQEGRLPNLARLRECGGYGRLASSAELLAGSIWPTFHSGTLPGDHAHHHFIQWDKERMALLRPTTDWLPQRVFWRDAAAAGRRTVAVDVPSVYAPEPFNGVEIYGWCNTDLLASPGSYPPEAFEWARRTFGDAQMGDEVYSTERPEALRRLRDDLVRWTGQTTRLSAALMERESWDLMIVNLSATHRAGHKLWSRTCEGMETDADDEPGEALASVYAACDRAVGGLLETGEATHTLVFSLHGMGPNTSRVAVLPELLDRVVSGRSVQSHHTGMLHRLRASVPNEWRSRVKSLLPVGVQDRLTVFWRLGGVDLASSKAFPLVADLQGYIRINVRGREARGVVEPGAEYESLCERIVTGLQSFVDADTDEPVVAEVVRADESYPDGVRRGDLPDLIVRWSCSPASRHRAIVSPIYGSVAWPCPGGHPDGRTGNHRGEGFLLAKGAGIEPGSSIEGAHIVDLAPTVFALLDLAPRSEWTGAPLSFAVGAG